MVHGYSPVIVLLVVFERQYVYKSKSINYYITSKPVTHNYKQTNISSMQVKLIVL